MPMTSAEIPCGEFRHVSPGLFCGGERTVTAWGWETAQLPAALTAPLQPERCCDPRQETP